MPSVSNSGMKENEGVCLVPVNWLKPHEQFISERFLEVLKETLQAGGYRWPIVVDRDTGVILDGHHRHQVALALKLLYVPAILVDYVKDSRISVQRWQPELDSWFSTSLCGGDATRHSFSSTVDSLGQGVSRLTEESMEPNSRCISDDECTPSTTATLVVVDSPAKGAVEETIPSQTGGLISTGSREKCASVFPWSNDTCASSIVRIRKPSLGPVHPIRFNGSEFVVRTAGDDDVFVVVDSKMNSGSADELCEPGSMKTGLVERNNECCTKSERTNASPIDKDDLTPAITKENIIRMGLSDSLFPPKSSRHLMPSDIYAINVFYDFRALRDG